MQSRSMVALRRDEHTSRLLALLLAIGFLGLAGVSAAAFWVQRNNQISTNHIQHTLNVEARINAFASANERAETARRGYLIQPASSFHTLMEEAQAERRRLFSELAGLTEDNTRQRAQIAALHKRLDELDSLQDSSLRSPAFVAATGGNFEQQPAVLLMRKVRRHAQLMLKEERRLLVSQQREQQRAIARFNLLLIVSATLVVALSAATLALIRRNLADLRASRNNLNVLNDELETLVDIRTGDLQRANAEIQRFAYIVSHDMRSPLVNVMGFTAELETARKTIADWAARVEERDPDLMDKDTRLAIEEDLPESIGFIRSSTQKMDRLINAILRLSREGRRTLTPERVALEGLVRSIADSLHHRIAETGTTLEIGELPTVTSDRLALEQILSNLIENAVKYLRPGVPGQIRISGHTELGHAVIEVSDNGRGIEPRDHERIFDLFRRSGPQDQPGEGIGLAHVRALAYRLGGLIEVQSEPGSGSTFRIELPIDWRPGDNHG